MALEDDVDDVLETLERARDKIDQLKDERDQLVKANKKLIRLVRRIETQVEDLLERTDDQLDEFSESGYEYSYGEGWSPTDVVHKESLDVSETVNLSGIKAELHQIEHMMERIRTYKSQQQER